MGKICTRGFPQSVGLNDYFGLSTKIKSKRNKKFPFKKWFFLCHGILVLLTPTHTEPIDFFFFFKKKSKNKNADKKATSERIRSFQNRKKNPRILISKSRENNPKILFMKWKLRGFFSFLFFLRREFYRNSKTFQRKEVETWKFPQRQRS